MKISIMGLGWFGLPLACELKKNSYFITGSTQTEIKKMKIEQLGISPHVLKFPTTVPQLLKSDLIILNIPPFDEQLSWFKSWDWDYDCKIIFVSSTSVVTDPGSKNSHLLANQEDWVRNNFKTWSVLRFGGLFGENRHPGKYLSGKKNLPGRLWPVNLLSLKDAIGFTKTVIQNNLFYENFNVVGDGHPSREDFYSSYCKKNMLALPQFDLTDKSNRAVAANDLASKYYSFSKIESDD